MQIRRECEDIFGEMGPRRKLAPHVPNQDFRSVRIDAFGIAERLRTRLSAATGGLTRYRHGDGDYEPPDGLKLAEQTILLETFLPRVVFDGLRLHLLDLFIDFGHRARQDVMQVEVESRGFQITTKLLRNGRGDGIAGDDRRDALPSG